MVFHRKLTLPAGDQSIIFSSQKFRRNFDYFLSYFFPLCFSFNIFPVSRRSNPVVNSAVKNIFSLVPGAIEGKLSERFFAYNLSHSSEIQRGSSR